MNIEGIDSALENYEGLDWEIKHTAIIWKLGETELMFGCMGHKSCQKTHVALCNKSRNIGRL